MSGDSSMIRVWKFWEEEVKAEKKRVTANEQIKSVKVESKVFRVLHNF